MVSRPPDWRPRASLITLAKPAGAGESGVTAAELAEYLDVPNAVASQAIELLQEG